MPSAVKVDKQALSKGRELVGGIRMVFHELLLLNNNNPAVMASAISNSYNASADSLSALSSLPASVVLDRSDAIGKGVDDDTSSAISNSNGNIVNRNASVENNLNTLCDLSLLKKLFEATVGFKAVVGSSYMSVKKSHVGLHYVHVTNSSADSGGNNNSNSNASSTAPSVSTIRGNDSGDNSICDGSKTTINRDDYNDNNTATAATFNSEYATCCTGEFVMENMSSVFPLKYKYDCRKCSVVEDVGSGLILNQSDEISHPFHSWINPEIRQKVRKVP